MSFGVDDIYERGYERGYEDARKKYERPTGYWINMKADDLRINDYQCSNCGNWSDEGKEYFPFCWRCGADMRGGTQ